MPDGSKAMTDLAHVVVVDDEPDIRRELKEYLTRHNCQVSTAGGGAAMRRILERQSADLIIMDLTMPEEDGLTLVKSIRKTSNAGIIILTGERDPVDRVVGLELGADDYVSKPCSLRELLARVRSVLRRTAGPIDGDSGGEDTWFEFDGWRLNINTRQLLSRSHVEVSLTTAEFNLLAAFVGSRRCVLSRDRLLDLTHSRNGSPFDRVIDNLVSRLRRKIECDPKSPPFIKTVRGVGYVFTPHVTKVARPNSASLSGQGMSRSMLKM